MQRLPISGIPIDVEFVFIFSVALLSVLLFLLMFIVVLILWVRKIRHRVEKAIQAGTSEKKIFSPFINNAFAYSDVDMKEDETDFNQTLFEVNGSNTVAEGSENGPCSKITDSEGLVSSSGHEQGAQSCKVKIYKSLKNPTATDYAKLYEETLTKNACSEDAEDFIHNETDATNEQDYLVLIGGDAEQTAKKLQESQGKAQQSGNASKILNNNKVDGLVDDDTPQNEYENEYLAVIHSETTSALSEGAKNVMPQHEDESAYLVPIETLSTEKQQRRQEKDDERHSERKPKASGSLETDKRAQASAVARGGVQMAPYDGGKNSYEYVSSWVVKECRDNSQEAQYVNQEITVHTGDKGKMPSNENNDLEDHGKKVANSATTEIVQEQQNHATDEVYDVIRDGDNHGYTEVSASEATPEVIYQNQNDMEELSSTQNAAGVGSSDDGPIYANSIQQG